MNKINIFKKAFVIAEIAQAHDGSLGIAHSFIDALAETGIDGVKFQTHIAEAESSELEPFRIKFSYQDTKRIDYWKRISFSEEHWMELKKHCEELNLEFMSSPFSIAAVELLERIGVKRYKIASGEVNNDLLLQIIAQTGKPVIISSGMSSYAELDRCIEIFRRSGNSISILQCTTQYPTSANTVGLNVLTELKERYNVPVGLSDHSGLIYPSLAAVALGASIIEVHVVFDRRMFGPDSKSSLTIDEIKTLVEGVKFIRNSLNSPIDKNNVSEYAELKIMFGKALSVNKNLNAGHIITEADLETKKPLSAGIPAEDYNKIINKPLLVNKKKNDFLQYIDFNQY